MFYNMFFIYDLSSSGSRLEGERVMSRWAWPSINQTVSTHSPIRARSTRDVTNYFDKSEPS